MDNAFRKFILFLFKLNLNKDMSQVKFEIFLRNLRIVLIINNSPDLCYKKVMVKPIMMGSSVAMTVHFTLLVSL